MLQYFQKDFQSGRTLYLSATKQLQMQRYEVVSTSLDVLLFEQYWSQMYFCSRCWFSIYLLYTVCAFKLIIKE